MMRRMSNPWPMPDAALPTRYEYLRSEVLSSMILPNSPQMRMKRDREEALRKCKDSATPDNHAATADDDLNPTSPAFRRFAEFPQELQDIIWTLALPPGRTITPRMRMFLWNREPNLVNIACNMDIIPRSHLDAIATPLMHTCKSSRKIALKHYQVAINPLYSSVGGCPNFYIDFFTDVLHMDWMVARAILMKLGGPDDLYEPIMKNLRFLSCFQHVATSPMFTLKIFSLAKMEKLVIEKPRIMNTMRTTPENTIQQLLCSLFDAKEDSKVKQSFVEEGKVEEKRKCFEIEFIASRYG